MRSSWISLLAITLPFTAVAGSQPSVTIKNGTVHGVDLPQFGQSLFLGIPYAQPPVGDLRLRPPRSVNESFGTLNATAYGPHCWSAFTTGFDDNSGFNNSEDCLTLNVIRPDGVSENSPVPVVVWIHGGGLADFRYNGTWLVQASVANGKPIVFVSINYRLASFGFLSSKALADEGSLNIGVRDQRLALHWVQENIAKFGGNPKKVTIQGQRCAGSTSVHVQILAYDGRNDRLFNQAICESGTSGNFSLPNSTAFQATYNGLLANTTCVTTANSTEEAQLSCLRSLPVDEFRQNSVGTTGLVFDGDFIAVNSTAEAYKSGKWVKVAFIVGSNTDEGRSFATFGANTTAQANASLTSVPVQFRNAILELYPNVPALGCPFNTGDFQLDPVQNGAFATPGLQNKRVAAIIGDVGMAGVGEHGGLGNNSPLKFRSINIGKRCVLRRDSPHFPYLSVNSLRFNHKPWSVSFSVEDFIGHFTEVGYAFNTQNNDTDFWITNHFTATYLGPTAPIEDRFLGVYMSRTWASFIATGDPNNANVTSKITWPKYSEGQENMVWQTQGSTTEKDNYREAAIQFIIDNLY